MWGTYQPIPLFPKRDAENISVCPFVPKVGRKNRPHISKGGRNMSIKLLYGEETYLLETKLKKIKKDFGEMIKGINFIQIDETNSDELISDIETPAFGF